MLKLYPRLALVNIRNHRKNYVPYILAGTGTIMMFYIICSLSVSDSVAAILGGEALQYILTMGYWIIGIFAVIFLFYTSSFLVKQRKKEFGLFNILGMERRHISRILLVETLVVTLVSLILGLGGGFLLSKLVLLILLRLLQLPVTFGFEFSLFALRNTLLLFGAIYLLTYLNTVRQIHLTSPVELLKGGQVGEREPRVKWLTAVVGVACLGAGYYIAITTESPLDALILFFVAAVLVIIGTYCLFSAVSVAVLKLLKRNKGYYYKAKHFIPVSGMIYRMNRNAVGLGNICILSTMVLVMVSTTVCLYAGMEDTLDTIYPTELGIIGYDVPDELREDIRDLVRQTAADSGTDVVGLVDYSYVSEGMVRNGDSFTLDDGILSAGAMTALTLLTAEEYAHITGESVSLAPNEILLREELGQLEGDVLRLGDAAYTVQARLDESFTLDNSEGANYHFVAVAADEAAIADMLAALHAESDWYGGNYVRQYTLGFDTTLDTDGQYALHWVLDDALGELEGAEECFLSVRSRAEGAESGYALYGGLLFLGLFLGLLFVMATVLIIYYKQISEGYEDQERFAIMQKVGMSRREIRRAIRSQVLMVFFLPLIVACVHIAAAFGMITKLLSMLYLTNVGLFALTTLGTVAVFAVFYTVVYAVTAREYYKIVR